jgi:hypothetical protein
VNAWLLAALLCGPASAAVVETGGAIAPAAPVSGAIGASMGAGSALSPIALVPGASLLAPSLNVGAIFRVVPNEGSTSLPGSPMRVAAPLPGLPAAAADGAPGAPRQDSPRTGEASARRDLVPPSNAAGQSALPLVAADRSRGADAAAPNGDASVRLDAAGRELSAPLDESATSAETAAAAGRKVFYRAGDRALLAGGSAAPTPGAAAPAAPASERRDPILSASVGGSAEGEALRDAVASPIPSAAASPSSFASFRVPGSLLGRTGGAPTGASDGGAASIAAPVSFERLSLELGSGLVVKVRAALGFSPAARTPLPSHVAAKAPPARPLAPFTSTEMLERRGLLESLSASEAAASQQAASLPALLPELASVRAYAPASASRSVAAASPVFGLKIPARTASAAWWILALLPAVLVLIHELL